MFGGNGINRNYIESLLIRSNEPWQVIRQGLSNRSLAAVSVVEPNLIAVYGGTCGKDLAEDGYFLNTDSNTTKPIFGHAVEEGFTCTTPVQQVGLKEFITIGFPRYGGVVKMIKLNKPTYGKLFYAHAVNIYPAE